MSETPKPIAKEALKKVVLNAPEYDLNEIIDYVEWQSNKGRKRKKVKVLHLERMKSEMVFGREHVVWDVHTNEDDGRWWVITEPTNLYSQNEFPSLDYTLSFHVGVTARVASRDFKKAPEDSRDRLISVWRRWENAAEAIDQAKESEDFQAVGMMCRETLLEIVTALKTALTLNPKAEPPKAADFINWLILISDHYAGGERNSYIRSLLKNLSKDVWQLVNWITHTRSATLYEAVLGVETTENFIATLARVITYQEAEAPIKCPKCKSYRIKSVFEPDMNLEPPYVNVCEACGWNDFEEPVVVEQK